MTPEEEVEYYRFVFAWMFCRLHKNKTIRALSKDVLKRNFNSGWNKQQRTEVMKQALKIIEEDDQRKI